MGHARHWPAVLAFLVTTLAGGAARGEPGPPPNVRAELAAAWTAAKATATFGPADIRLDDQTNLKLAADQAFIPPTEANRIMSALGNPASPARKGLVVSSKDAPWMIDIDWIGDGYVRDGDAKEWKADELLANLKEGTEADNEQRLARGLPALDVIGWVEPPAYDPATHRLVWSLSLQDRGAPANLPRTINYNTYALGREGYYSLDLVTGSDTVGADKVVARNLLSSLRYAPGKRYEDFDGSTDRVAAYGLGALVGVVAAKKLGLLAMIGVFLVKAWKLALIALVGAGAAVRRVFSRRGAEDGGA